MCTKPSKKAGSFGALAIAFSLAACAQISPAKVPIRAYAPTPSKTPSSFVTINYGNATTTSIPDAFGGNNLPGNSTWQQNLINSGIKMIRSSYYISRIVPNTILNAYRSCMATGTPNVRDPKTWTWNLSPVPGMQAATALGQRVMAIMCYDVPFDSTTRNRFGTIQDYNIYEDIVKTMVQHYISIGGPATSIPRTDYLGVLHANTNILQRWVNFVSWHEYNAGVYNDTSMHSRGQSYWPGIRGYLSEWNYNTDCDDNSSDYDNDDPNNVPRFAARVISTIANGEGEEYATSCAAFDTNGNLLPKIYNWYLMSTQLGLGAGPASVKSTSKNGPTQAVGAVNSAGKPVVIVINHSSSSSTVAINFQNLNLSGDVSLQTYLVDHGSNRAQSPIENTSVNVSGGSTSHAIAMPPIPS